MGRVRDALERSRAVPLSDSLGVLWKDLEEWCGPASPHDDISLLGAEFTSPPS
jgi:hypothetical protein